MASLDAAVGGHDPIAFVRSEGATHTLNLAVEGARCAACISKIEGGVRALDGVKSARLNLSTGRLVTEFTGPKSEAERIARTVTALGYAVRPFQPETAKADARSEDRRLLRALAVAGFATANVMLLSVSVWSGEGEMSAATRQMLHWISALIALPAALFAGRPFFESAYRALRARHVNMDVPISLAVCLALGLSVYELTAGHGDTFFDAAVMLLFFLLIGRYLDSLLRARAGQAARQLAELQAAVAHRVDRNGAVTAVPSREIEPGDTLLVPAGDRVPVDGVITSGKASLDAALVTGETRPLDLDPGDAVYSGMINLSAPLTIEATAARDNSLLAEIARLVEAGEQSRSSYVRLADRAAQLYVPIVHALAAATLVGWIVMGGDVRAAILNAIAVLIITCPCALALAVPTVQIVACGRLFKDGILVKSGDALERLATARIALFDKTGTLTLGKPQLLNADALGRDVVERAAKLARTSRHPLSRAIADAAGMGDTANDIRDIAGGGLEGQLEGKRLRLGSARWLDVPQTGAEESEHLEVWFVDGDADPVRFAFSDQLRPDASAMVEALKARGLEGEILSGDRSGPVRTVARALGLERFQANLKPTEKIARIHSLNEAGAAPLMVGDGLNDAPALSAAHVSVSMGSAAEISRATSDLVIQGDRLCALPIAVDVARASCRRVFENFGLAIVYNCIAVPLAVFGFVTPLVAAIAMSASSLLVTANAMRLLRR